MSEYFAVKDPNWGPIGLYGRDDEIESLAWHEKRSYLKDTFASDGILITKVAHKVNGSWIGGFFILGTDADHAIDLLANGRFDYDLRIDATEHGTLLRFHGPGILSHELTLLGAQVYWYFAGGVEQEGLHELWGVIDWLDHIDDPTFEVPSQIVDDRPLIQQVLF